MAIVATACGAHPTIDRSPQSTPSFSATAIAPPLVFERNAGQAPAGYTAVARTSQVDAAFGADGVVFGLKDRRSQSTAMVSLSLRGARRVAPTTDAPLATRVNYLRGADARAWATNVPTFGRVRYEAAYPGIDLVFYGTDRRLEYDFDVAPHADAASITLVFDGADAVTLNAEGDLVVSAGGQTMTQKRPVAYQDRGGRRAAVPASYAIGRDGAVTFALGAYDRDAPLTIDPMIILAELWGGSDGDFANSVATAGGFVYIAGNTCSSDFPTANALQPALNGTGCDDAFVRKLTGDGRTVIFSTYLGGSKGDKARRIAVDASGAIYVAGDTASTDFPTTPGAWDRVCGNDGVCVTNGAIKADGFVSKLSSSGSTLVYSTYVGGSDTETVYGLAVNAAGEAVIAGVTQSADYPTTPGAPQRTRKGFTDVLITKLAADGSSLVYSTYFGGSNVETGIAAAFDAAGDAWVVGETESPDLPVMGAFQPSLANPVASGVNDGFVVKLTPSGSLALSTYFGGDRNDIVLDVKTDTTGVYIAGAAVSSMLPGQSAPRDVVAKTQTAFVSQLSSDGAHVIKTQLIDGNRADTAENLVITRPSGSPLIHVVGTTFSADLPVTSDAWQTALTPAGDGSGDLVYAVLPLDGSGALASPSFATYLGDAGFEQFPRVAADGSDGAFILTNTSGAFPQINTPSHPARSVDAVIVHVVPESRWTESVAGDVHLYAADATATGSEWSLVADPSAADGRRAANVDHGAPKVTTPLSSPASFVEWTFDADPGAYRLWVRGKAQANSFNNDSVYVQFSDSVDAAGNPTWQIGTTSATPVILEDCSGCGVHGWGWNDNGYGAGVLGPLVRFNTVEHRVMRVQAREDGLSIDQIVLSKMQYASAAPGATKDDTTVLKRTAAVPPPPPPPPPGDCTAGEVVVYPGLHSTIVGGASTWHTVADTTAAGHARVFYPDAGAPKVAAPSAAPSSFFTVSFTADANVDYHIWLRGKAQNNFWGNDSAWLQFNDAITASGSPLWRTGTMSGTSVNLEDCSGCGELEWGWQDNGYPSVLGQAVRFPTPGTHSMLVQIREDGYSIDQIVLSSGKYLGAAPGALKNDTTILPECQAPPLR